ncbi:MAG: hypothetical protein QOJ98_3588 [Acidobacteriota bacterium]|nr:hypothetical protein [Acidobacteriota bacterium]
MDCSRGRRWALGVGRLGCIARRRETPRAQRLTPNALPRQLLKIKPHPQPQVPCEGAEDDAAGDDGAGVTASFFASVQATRPKIEAVTPTAPPGDGEPTPPTMQPPSSRRTMSVATAYASALTRQARCALGTDLRTPVAQCHTHGGAVTHPRWRSDTPPVAQRHTPVAQRHTPGGAATHSRWRSDTPRWRSDTPAVAQRHTRGGAATYPRWRTCTPTVSRCHTPCVHVRTASAAAAPGSTCVGAEGGKRLRSTDRQLGCRAEAGWAVPASPQVSQRAANARGRCRSPHAQRPHPY